jgi:hypothetical protein
MTVTVCDIVDSLALFLLCYLALRMDLSGGSRFWWVWILPMDLWLFVTILAMLMTLKADTL